MFNSLSEWMQMILGDPRPALFVSLIVVLTITVFGIIVSHYFNISDVWPWAQLRRYGKPAGHVVSYAFIPLLALACYLVTDTPRFSAVCALGAASMYSLLRWSKTEERAQAQMYSKLCLVFGAFALAIFVIETGQVKVFL